MFTPSRSMRFLRAVLLVLGAAVCGGAHAASQSYPDRPITLIVPYAPGATDQEARRLAEGMSKELGQTVIVENRAGAGGVVGTQAAARAKPDGYTLLYAAPAVITVAPLLGNAQYRYEDLLPVARSTTSPHVLASRSNAPFKTLPQLIDYAKKNPGKVVFGSSGTGTAVHLAGEAFARAAGIEFNHVPYGGLTPAITAALGGFADLVIGLPVAIKPQVDGGKLLALAQFGATRAPTLADVPTLKEEGIPLTLSVDIGVFAPAGTPADIVARIGTAVEKTVQSAEFKSFAQGALVMPGYLDSAGYRSAVDAERKLYAEIFPALKVD
ncbi:tripartite tricarboxylate transporter substrate binding protein [Bordetella sp. BOR01]|uniref:Bug family tripartite tricarboxylate transporter substrate binding protein n=1 Tax=Bordetella sp. BOR01 TaxID=2854779 RepID=UPI001C45E2C9|nr:tripartite tricarboxylate transporter substrate binding protein [Bordetella sp. BOR01]MBV7483185.1 tripartite tricarboxylate transporter substrate binding protein [Bordetella sp. BOR01]